MVLLDTEDFTAERYRVLAGVGNKSSADIIRAAEDLD
jgi:hypothetical protein